MTLEEFKELVSEWWPGFKSVCREIVSCDCGKCRFWINSRRRVPEHHQFACLTMEIGRMVDAERVGIHDGNSASITVAEAIHAKSDEVIAYVCQEAEDAMLAAIALEN